MEELTRQEKYRLSMIKKYGSEAKWREAMKTYGARADRSTPRGFARMSAEQKEAISIKGAQARWGKELADNKDGYARWKKEAEKDARTEDS